MKILVIFLCFILVISCNSQNSNSMITTNKIQQTRESFEFIGIKNIDNISYRSFYTQEALKKVVPLYYKQLMMESSKVNVIALFYDEKQHTPTSNELSNQDKRFNKNLLGGIERQQGKYFLLLKDDNQFLIRKILTID